MSLLNRITSVVHRAVYGAPPTDSPPSLDAIALTRLDETPLPHAELAGKVVLFVNVASRCGLTPQYAALTEVAHKYAEKGLVVVGAPCNQFAGQEPGSAAAIAEFCAANYGADFPLLAKLDVNGAERHPLYRWLIASDVGGGKDIGWNFEKFLVGRDGRVAHRFSPTTVPDAPDVVAAIEAALADPAA